MFFAVHDATRATIFISSDLYREHNNKTEKQQSVCRSVFRIAYVTDANKTVVRREQLLHFSMPDDNARR